MQAAGQARNLAGRGVAMQRALADSPPEAAFRFSQGRGGGRRVAAGDGLQSRLDRAMDAGLDRAVAFVTLEILAMALLRRRMNRDVRHNLI